MGTSPAALMERFVSMFLKAEEGPVASGSGKAALAPTVGFVLAVSDNHPQSRIITSALWFPKSGYCHPLACVDMRSMRIGTRAHVFERVNVY